MKRIILRLLFKLRILKFLNLTWSANRHGKTFNIPLIAATGFEFFFSDKETWMLVILKIMNELTGGQGTFVDVGANVGQTLLKVKSLDNDWEYIGFEPNPNCLQYLFNLAKANRFSNAQFLPFGLSDRLAIGNLSLFNESPVDSSASVVAGFRSNPITSFAVPLMAGDEMPNLFQDKVAVIKIDVEGGELEVLKGLRSIIERDRPFVLCEVLPVYGNATDLRLGRQLKLEQILREVSYVKLQVHPDGSLSYCEEIGIHNSIENVNYLLCPESTYDVVMSKFDVLS
jgi:FkbM family methyltransferase